MIKYLPLRDINARYDAELREAVGRVLDSGWYLRARPHDSLNSITPSTSVRATA